MSSAYPITTALLYLRVSDPLQDKDGLSLPVQLAETRRYAAGKAWALGKEYVDVMTGKRDDRPKYQELLGDVRRMRAEGRPLALVVIRLDRLGRRVLERVQRREEFKALGVPVHSVREGGEVSDLVANILASVAEEESRQLSERVAHIVRHVRANGWHFPGRPPWGLRYRPATEEERAEGAPRSVLDEQPAESPHVREAWRRVADGESVRAVQRWAASLPAGARGGRVMTFSDVRKMFDSLAYAPESYRWPRLIEPATWERARDRIAAHRALPRQASGSYLLTGLIRCPRCGGRMYGQPPAPRPQREPTGPRYRCYGRQAGARAPDPGCTASLMGGPLEAAVLATVEELVKAFPPGRLEAAWERRRRAEGVVSPPAPADRAERLERERARAKKRLADAAIKLVDGILPRAGYDAAVEQIEADLRAVEAELGRLEGAAAAPVPQPLPPLAAALAALGRWREALEGATDSRRQVLALFVLSVTPARIGHGRWEPRIAWTALGEALRRAAPAAGE